jgi:hypothetical protein
VYPWGEEWEDGVCNSAEAHLGSASAVGIFPRNESPLALQDMAGNVWEWCADLWEKGAVRRVIRGGGWGDGAGHCRSAFRGRSEPANRWVDLGFRVVAPHAQPDTRLGGSGRSPLPSSGGQDSNPGRPVRAACGERSQMPSLDLRRRE